MIGKTVGHYEIQDKLGSGGMGTVYRARDTRLDREIALKVLPPDAADEPGRRERFEREARAVAALSHPNIVTIFSVEEVDGLHFLTMELVDGEPLSTLAERGALARGRLVEIATVLSEAVGAAHERGIVHRDLKPANVMLTRNGHVKVLDFGLARLRQHAGADAPTIAGGDAQTADGVVLGTLAYMSPEQAQGQPVDPRSDIFSLGVILYELATGKHPFRAKSGMETAARILRDDPPPVTDLVPDLPADIARIIRRCLAKKPRRRYQSALDLRNDLEDLREDLTSAPAAPAPGTGQAPGMSPSPPPAPPTSSAPGTPTPTASGLTTSTTTSGLSGDRPGIAVVTFDDHTGAPEHAWLATGLPSMLVTGLAQTPGLDVVSTERVHELAKMLGHAGAGPVPRELVSEIGRQAGATAIMTGSVFRAGDRFRIDVRASDVMTGRLLTGEAVTGDDVFALVDELTSRIARGLDVASGSGSCDVCAVTTPSIEAYREYDAGCQAQVEYRYTDAREHFLRAVEIDPEFAAAHLRLSWIFHAFSQESRSLAHREKVRQHANRLPERDRALFRAMDVRHEDPREAIAILEALLQKFPDTERGYLMLANQHLVEFHDRRKWYETVRRGIRAMPKAPELRNVFAYQCPYFLPYERAVQELETYQQLTPESSNALDSLAEVTMVYGRCDQALAMYERLGGSTQMSELVGKSYCLATLGRYPEALEATRALRAEHEEREVATSLVSFLEAFYLSRVGRYAAAATAIREGVETARRHETREDEIDLETLATIIGFERGRSADVYQAAGRVRSLAGDSRDRYRRQVEIAIQLMGVTEARSGRPAAAEEMVEELQKIDPDPMTEWAHLRHWLDGEIALARGDVDGAEERFARAPDWKRLFGFGAGTYSIFGSNEIVRDWPARIAVARGDLDAALAVYSELTTPHHDWRYTAALEPRYVLEMARIHRRKGDDAEACTHFERFLELWSDADEGLPELEEARTALA